MNNTLERSYFIGCLNSQKILKKEGLLLVDTELAANDLGVSTQSEFKVKSPILLVIFRRGSMLTLHLPIAMEKGFTTCFATSSSMGWERLGPFESGIDSTKAKFQLDMKKEKWVAAKIRGFIEPVYFVMGINEIDVTMSDGWMMAELKAIRGRIEDSRKERSEDSISKKVKLSPENLKNNDQSKIQSISEIFLEQQIKFYEEKSNELRNTSNPTATRDKPKSPMLTQEPEKEKENTKKVPNRAKAKPKGIQKSRSKPKPPTNPNSLPESNSKPNPQPSLNEEEPEVIIIPERLIPIEGDFASFKIKPRIQEVSPQYINQITSISIPSDSITNSNCKTEKSPISETPELKSQVELFNNQTIPESIQDKPRVEILVESSEDSPQKSISQCGIGSYESEEICDLVEATLLARAKEIESRSKTPIFQDSVEKQSSNIEIEEEEKTPNESIFQRKSSTKSNSSSKCDDCPICLSPLDESESIGRLNCIHVFCFTCIHDWSKVTNLCPICKREFLKIRKFIGDKIEEIAVEVRKDEIVYEIDTECDDQCYLCNESDDFSAMLICDDCHFYCAHYYCDGFNEVPAGQWRCQYCTQDTRFSTGTVSRSRRGNREVEVVPISPLVPMIPRRGRVSVPKIQKRKPFTNSFGSNGREFFKKKRFFWLMKRFRNFKKRRF